MAAVKSKNTKSKASTDNNESLGNGSELGAASDDITTSESLTTFLQSLLDRLAEDQVPPLFVFSVMNHLISSQRICALFCADSKELARDIWLRIKQSGMQVRNPVFLFGTDAQSAV
jgi:hypothetical protein